MSQKIPTEYATRGLSKNLIVDVLPLLFGYVTGCEAGPNADGVFTVMYTTLDGDVFSADDIGKTVFLTRQEAEAAVESAKTTKEEI